MCVDHAFFLLVFFTIVTDMNTYRRGRGRFLRAVSRASSLLPLCLAQDFSRQRVQGVRKYTTAKTQTALSWYAQLARAGHVPNHAQQRPQAPSSCHHVILPGRLICPMRIHFPAHSTRRAILSESRTPSSREKRGSRPLPTQARRGTFDLLRWGTCRSAASFWTTTRIRLRR